MERKVPKYENHKLRKRNLKGQAHTNTRKLNRDISTGTAVFLNRKRVKKNKLMNRERKYQHCLRKSGEHHRYIENKLKSWKFQPTWWLMKVVMPVVSFGFSTYFSHLLMLCSDHLSNSWFAYSHENYLLPRHFFLYYY